MHLDASTIEIIKLFANLFIIPLCIVIYKLDRAIVDLKLLMANDYVKQTAFAAHVADLWRGINELRDKIK